MTEAADRSRAARKLTAFQQNILHVLAEAPRYGLAIKRELEAYYDEEVNHGRLYPNLDSLVDEGLIEKTQLDKRTNEYTLTDEGVAAVEDLLAWSVARYVTDTDRAEFVQGMLEDATAD